MARAMDFVRILRSLEEVVYEAMTWIVFYPRTLWWSAVSPLRMLRYGQRELADSPDDQYTETLSPVLFLMITLALSHGLSQALAPAAMELRGAMARLMSSEQNQLITRSVAFAIFPLVFASQQLRRTGRSLDRNSLRAPFYAQCFIAALFSLALGLSTTLLRMDVGWARTLGAPLLVGSVLWYIGVQARWLRECCGVGLSVGLALAIYGFAKACAMVIAAALVLSWVV